jgi:Pyridine nucleotide-disulphide oxidoreductase
MNSIVDAVVIGAGPYGLSVASHLRAEGIEVRTLGFPMETWRNSMPAGMKLKSEGFASNIADPSSELTLGKYCSMNGMPYADIGLPTEVEIFSDYGEAFQRRFVPDIERTKVLSVELVPSGFALRLDTGERLVARRVIVATGIRAFDYIPPPLRDLSPELVTHSACYGDTSHLMGRKVLVIGAGASATNIAALLRAKGVEASLMTRSSEVRFPTPLGERSLFDKLRAPMTPLESSWKSLLCVKAPLVFHAMPEAFRVEVVRRYLGPSPAWFMRDAFVGHVPLITRSRILKAEARGSGVHLRIRHDDGSMKDISEDHIIAATGYHVDVDRLAFLSDRIRSGLRRAAGAPALSRNFESSVPHLYFVGTAAANSFGPMLRFVCGSGFCSRRLTRHLAAGFRRQRRSSQRVLSASRAQEPA